MPLFGRGGIERNKLSEGFMTGSHAALLASDDKDIIEATKKYNKQKQLNETFSYTNQISEGDKKQLEEYAREIRTLLVCKKIVLAPSEDQLFDTQISKFVAEMILRFER